MAETPYQANRMLALLSKAFQLAELWEWRPDGSNPCKEIQRYREEKRERYLSSDEFTRLADVLNQAEYELLTAIRKSRTLAVPRRFS